MFSKLSSFALVAVCTFAAAATARPTAESTTASTVTVEAQGKGGTPPAPNVITLVELCIDPNYGRCYYITDTVIPTGCINLTTIPGAAAGGLLQDSISSALPIAGVQCTIFA
ncbi:hypothetical protein H0H87_005811 [Tephrocybe sp. NHM501043]|nr:hypothetical protein H0H87_005811 [Tephrocybe sp. NHM501043]